MYAVLMSDARWARFDNRALAKAAALAASTFSGKLSDVEPDTVGLFYEKSVVSGKWERVLVRPRKK